MRPHLEDVLEFVENMDTQELHKVANCLFKNHHMAVVLDEASIGGSATTEIKDGVMGFDWNSGKFLVYTKDKIRR